MQIWTRYGNMTIDFRLELLNALVCSVLQYASEIWGWGKTEILERVEAKALKIALKIGDRVSVTAIRWLIGRYPVALRFWINAYKFWALLAGFPRERLEHHGLTAAWEMYERPNSSWIKEMVDHGKKVGHTRGQELQYPSFEDL